MHDLRTILPFLSCKHFSYSTVLSQCHKRLSRSLETLLKAKYLGVPVAIYIMSNKFSRVNLVLQSMVLTSSFNFGLSQVVKSL